jgi:SAM-dependent methyltransferase
MRARRLRRLLSHIRNWPLHPQWLLSQADETSDLDHALRGLRGRVLDIGCAGRRLARRLPADAHYIGLDYPMTAVSMYRTQPDVFGDARCLPFANASADAVILKDVLEHIRGPSQALAEISRVLRAGGSLVLWMPFMYPIHDAPHDFQRFTSHAMEAYLDDHGFRVRLCKPVLKPIETAALLTCLALGDAMETSLRRSRWLVPLVPVLALLVICANLAGKALSWLPSTRFMPAFYRVLAERVGHPDG